MYTGDPLGEDDFELLVSPNRVVVALRLFANLALRNLKGTSDKTHSKTVVVVGTAKRTQCFSATTKRSVAYRGLMAIENTFIEAKCPTSSFLCFIALYACSCKGDDNNNSRKLHFP